MRAKDNILEVLTVLAIGLGIIFFVLTTPACSTNMPKIDATFWAGDSAKDGISRSQENKTIVCKDPSFDDYVCLSYVDIQKIYSTMLRCKQWGVQTMTAADVKQFVNENPEVVSNVLRVQKSMESLQH